MIQCPVGISTTRQPGRAATACAQAREWKRNGLRRPQTKSMGTPGSSAAKGRAARYEPAAPVQVIQYG